MAALLNRMSGGAIFLAIFSLFAVLAWQTIPATVASVEPPQAATDFARYWGEGKLDEVSYDPASGPGVDEGDSKQIAENVTAMVTGISESDENHPVRVSTVGEPRTQTGDNGELRDGDVIQSLEITWDLGEQLDDRRMWTYRSEVVVRETEGRSRVMWRPSTVHPALTQGLIMTARRLLPPRAPILDASEQPVGVQTAPELIGTVQPATAALAQTYPARVRAGDVIGVGGLQQVYDARLAGRAGVGIDVVPVEDAEPLEPPVRQVHVVPPVPGKPLQLSLDPAWQARGRAAVQGARTATALLAINALTGQVLVDANAATSGEDLALQGRYPPGSAMRPVTTLAALGADLLQQTTRLDCTPWAYQGQRFTSTGSATGAGVDLATAFAQGCRSGFARLAEPLSDTQQRDAAHALGIGVPSATGAGAFDGTLPDSTSDLNRVLNAIGEGQVLVSPLALARMSAAVSAGIQREPTLAGPVDGEGVQPPGETVQPLDTGGQALLQQLMAASVVADPDLAPLRTASAGQVSAVGGEAPGYGPATSPQTYAWCTGYQGDVAFAVLVTGTGAQPARAATAAQIAADFLG